ncbi:MAG: hypothetical protein JW820_05095 [Spirochaetales bacterium]|nr:hypothetical protein [Spirochaetales bacterium]
MISKELNRELMELIGYMVTSARGLVDEPKSYGPFRLIEGVSRLCETLQSQQGADREFLTELRATIDESKFVLMTDMGAFVEMLDRATLQYARKLKTLEE